MGSGIPKATQAGSRRSRVDLSLRIVSGLHLLVELRAIDASHGHLVREKRRTQVTRVESRPVLSDGVLVQHVLNAATQQTA